MLKQKIIHLRDHIYEQTQDWDIEEFYQLQAELETIADLIFSSNHSLMRIHRPIAQ